MQILFLFLSLAYTVQYFRFIFLCILTQIINCTSEMESDSNIDLEVDVDAADESSDAESQVKRLFVSTRSGRIAGNWRLSSYIGKKGVLNFPFLIVAVTFISKAVEIFIHIIYWFKCICLIHLVLK